MKLSIGIVGLPNVGKSTLFKILTKQEVHIANYPFATIDPNVGVVTVPDERLQKLAAMSKSKKIIPAVVEFYDIAGLVKGANKGEGLGNQFLSHIRDTQAIVIVLRVFKNDEIIHVESSVDPVRDLEIINTELALKDLETVEKRLGKLEGEAPTRNAAHSAAGGRTGKKEVIDDLVLVTEVKKWLETGKLVTTSTKLYSSILQNTRIADLNLLTAKKQLYLLNGAEGDVSPEILQKIKSIGADHLVMDLAPASAEATADKGATDITPLIKKAYEILNLMSFLTTGEDETRAWTIQRGMKAPQAAGVIHTDFENKFIRAEAINWRKLLDAGSWVAAKQKGLIRVEGKEYVVQDGDVIIVRHG